ncbi:MAG TPA: replication protein A [Methanosarcina sp.]|nr:replication protein A [Methanosarcina sp.]
MKQTAESIRDRFLKLGIDVPLEDIEKRLDELIKKFKVPSNEAQRSVTNYFLKKYSIPKNEFYARQAETQLTKIAGISESGQWANLKVKVLQLWETTHDSISQVGLLGDETGIIKFTEWKNAELPALEQGESYLLRSVVIGEYNDRFQVELNRKSSVEKLNEDVEVVGADFKRESELQNVADLKEGQWATVKAKVVQLWENTHESIEQTGLLGDPTGIIKFTNWASSELPDMEKGKSYLLKNVVVNEWGGKIHIELNKNSSVEELNEPIEVGGGDFKLEARESELRNIADLKGGQWATVKAKVVQLWEKSHESIEQAGLLGDPTGIIKFTNWASSELPDMEKGKSYLLKNVVVNEWSGKAQIELNRSSSIEKLDEDIKVGTSTFTYSGAMVDIQTGSGLIKRCPECKRALVKGACAEHGKVKGEYDLRIKAVLDSGTSTQDTLINRELTEKLAGISLDAAIAMAADALDPGVVLDKLKNELLGKYYIVSGHKLDRYILVDSITPQLSLDRKLLNEMITELEVE